MKNRLFIAVFSIFIGLFTGIGPAYCEEIEELFCTLTGGVWEDGKCITVEPEIKLSLKVSALGDLTVESLDAFPVQITLTDIPYDIYDIYALFADNETDLLYIARITLFNEDTFVMQHSPSIHPYKTSQTGSEQIIDIFDVCTPVLESDGGVKDRYVFYLGVALPDTVENGDFSSLLAAAFRVD